MSSKHPLGTNANGWTFATGASSIDIHAGSDIGSPVCMPIGALGGNPRTAATSEQRMGPQTSANKEVLQFRPSHCRLT